MNDVTVPALTVHGTPSADEIAAVLALLCRTPIPRRDSIAAWRNTRRAARVSAALPRPVRGGGAKPIR